MRIDTNTLHKNRSLQALKDQDKSNEQAGEAGASAQNAQQSSGAAASNAAVQAGGESAKAGASSAIPTDQTVQPGSAMKAAKGAGPEQGAQAYADKMIKRMFAGGSGS